MEGFTETEIQKILSLYRSYLQTNQIRLTEEERGFMLKGIDLKEFRCVTIMNGIIGYKGWSLPILFVKEQDKTLLENAHALALEQKHIRIFKSINEMIYASCLLNIWNGSVSDEMLIYAALIDAGHHQEVLPIIKESSRNFTTVDRQASALLSLQQEKEKKDEKHEDLPF